MNTIDRSGAGRVRLKDCASISSPATPVALSTAPLKMAPRGVAAQADPSGRVYRTYSCLRSPPGNIAMTFGGAETADGIVDLGVDLEAHGNRFEARARGARHVSAS